MFMFFVGLNILLLIHIMANTTIIIAVTRNLSCLRNIFEEEGGISIVFSFPDIINNNINIHIGCLFVFSSCLENVLQ